MWIEKIAVVPGSTDEGSSPAAVVLNRQGTGWGTDGYTKLAIVHNGHFVTGWISGKLECYLLPSILCCLVLIITLPPLDSAATKATTSLGDNQLDSPGLKGAKWWLAQYELLTVPELPGQSPFPLYLGLLPGLWQRAHLNFGQCMLPGKWDLIITLMTSFGGLRPC